MKKYKNIILLIGTAVVLVLASFHLLTKQRQKRNAAPIVGPASGLSGGLNCELPIPDVTKRDSDRLETIKQTLQINSKLRSAGKISTHYSASHQD